MDSWEADLLKEIDPAELGQRLRSARIAKGWTQTELASGDVSVGYISRIESGQRRPNASVLNDLAVRLGVPVDHLLRGVSGREYDEIKLTLDFSELSLETGDHLEEETRAREALDRAAVSVQDDLAKRAHYLIARALEGQGSTDDAILELEPLIASTEIGIFWIKCAIALSRCYRDSGDLNKAVEIGERVMASLEGTPLDSCDEAVQMAVTLAAAYYERGDAGQAVRTCRKAVTKAERLDSPKARASAYWNASMMEAFQGSVANAVPLAERALALLAEGNDSRNVARLRTQLGSMQLQLNPPEVEAAHLQLEQAARELEWCSATPVEIARNDLALARAMLLQGELSEAVALSTRAFDAAGSLAPLFAADAKSLQGQVAVQQGHAEEAKRSYLEAVMVLTGIGADRGAAQLWFELAGLLEDVGDFDSARDAYRSAAASTGLKSRSVVSSVRLQDTTTISV
jgi:transcriptional regulator with XRE-family HTH domain